MSPFSRYSSTDREMILHAMKLVNRNVQYLNPRQISVVTVDQPIFVIVKKLLRFSSCNCGNVGVMVDSFHTEKQEREAVGDLLEGSEWPAILMETCTSESGTANALNKATSCHKVKECSLGDVCCHKEAFTGISRGNRSDTDKERLRLP